MEHQVLGQMPRAGLLLLPLLLCFGPETARSNRPPALEVVIDYVNCYGGVAEQYAFTVSLPQETCRNPKDIETYLPKTQLRNMRNVILQPSGLYNPGTGSIVAARPRKVTIRRRNYTEHSEWRLLQGGQNSLVAQLTARTYGQNSCLILFTLNSPCYKTCLNGPFNIVNMTSAAFSAIDNNYKAFVFQKIFRYDMTPEVTRQALLNAWHQLHNVPLLCCDNNGCHDCAPLDPQNNPCLAGKP